MPIVNIVREYGRFIEYAADEGLTANEMVLWYALMHIFNARADGQDWPGDFIRISNDRLLTFCPMGLDSLIRARNRLKQKGLIDFIPGDRRKSNPSYKMFYFSSSFCSISATNNTGNMQGNMQGNLQGNSANQYINYNDIEKETPLKGRKESAQKRFTPPTAEEVAEYWRGKGFQAGGDDAADFVDFYAGKDWMIGKNKMKDWRAAANRWARENKRRRNGAGKRVVAAQDYSQRDYTDVQERLIRERDAEMAQYMEARG